MARIYIFEKYDEHIQEKCVKYVTHYNGLKMLNIGTKYIQKSKRIENFNNTKTF